MKQTVMTGMKNIIAKAQELLENATANTRFINCRSEQSSDAHHVLKCGHSVDKVC